MTATCEACGAVAYAPRRPRVIKADGRAACVDCLRQWRLR